MAATVRSSGQFVGVGSVTSGVVPLPTGWQAGDVCYLWAVGRATTGTITGPAGYAVLVASFHASSSTSSQMALYRRVLHAGAVIFDLYCLDLIRRGDGHLHVRAALRPLGRRAGRGHHHA